MPDSFDLSKLTKALAGTPFAPNLHYLPSVGSTNLLALEAAQAGAIHGSVWVPMSRSRDEDAAIMDGTPLQAMGYTSACFCGPRWP